MYPEIDIGNLTFSSYSLLYFLAFLLSILIFWIELRRKKESFKIFVLISLTLLFSGFAGAKIFYIILNVSLKDFLKDPINTILASGKIYHGGFILSVLVGLFLVKLTKRNFWVMADSTAPALALGICVGRIGCFLNGCCLGKPTSLPWGVSFPGMGYPPSLRLHPTQVYESIITFFIFLFLWRVRKKDYAPGYLFSAYLLIWGCERFLLEFLRTNVPTPFFSLSIAQIISLGIALFASLNLFRLARFRKSKNLERED